MTRPLNGTGSNFHLPETRPGTAPLKAPVPAPAKPAPEPDRSKLSGHGQPSEPTAMRDLLAAQQALSAKKQALALKEMAARNQAAEKPGLFQRVRNAWNSMVDGAAKELDGLRAEVAAMENKVTELASEGAHLVAQGAKATAHAVRDGVNATADGYRQGHGVIGALGDGAGAAGTTMAKEVINPMLDRSSLGKADEYRDKDGALGELLTNRLAVGESASLKIEAGATLPFEALGLPNARLDGGGTLEVKRVAKLGPDGKPLTEPKDDKGNGPTELKVKLSLEGRAGAFYSAEVGTQAGATVGEKTLGFNASARAEAEAGLTGKVEFTFSFDPQNQKDMDSLTGMIKATAETGAAAAIPGIGPLLGSASAVSNAKNFAAFGKHLESVDGSGGLYAQATASAAADVGMFAATDKNAVTGKRDKTYREKNEEETSVDQFVADLGLLEASIGGQGKVGGKQNLRTGEKTFYVEGLGALSGAASVLGAGTEGSAAVNRRLAVTYDKAGKLSSVRIEDTIDAEKFKGLRTSIEDIYGRPLSSGAVAGLSEKDTIKVSYEVKPEVLASLQKKLGGSAADRASALKELGRLAVTKDTVKLNVGDVTATTTNALSFGGSVKVAAGAVAGLRGKVTLARGQDRVLD